MRDADADGNREIAYSQSLRAGSAIVGRKYIAETDNQTYVNAAVDVGLLALLGLGGKLISAEVSAGWRVLKEGLSVGRRALERILLPA